MRSIAFIRFKDRLRKHLLRFGTYFDAIYAESLLVARSAPKDNCRPAIGVRRVTGRVDSRIGGKPAEACRAAKERASLVRFVHATCAFNRAVCDKAPLSERTPS